MPARWKEPPYEVRRSAIQGRGVFATRRIRKGTRIIEYTGESIDQDEADARYDDDAMKHHHTFLFILDDDVIIDGAAGGNEARLINHSCDPNCVSTIEDGHIYIDAIRTIQPGEELLYDYQLEREGPAEPHWETLYACRCGAESCRGSILMTVRRPKRKRAAATKRRRTAKTPRRSPKPKRARATRTSRAPSRAGRAAR